MSDILDALIDAVCEVRTTNAKHEAARDALGKLIGGFITIKGIDDNELVNRADIRIGSIVRSRAMRAPVANDENETEVAS